MSDPPKPRTRGLRATFWAYALLLSVGTHWPNLAVQTEVVRTDLFVHAFAFAGWTTLLMLTRYFGPARATRSALVCAGVAALAALADETTQAIPGLGRHASVSDYGADCLGIGVGAGATLIATRALAKNAAG